MGWRQGTKLETSAMTMRKVALDELKGLTLEEVLSEVAAQQEILTITLPDGQNITIQPSPELEPLPLLKGTIPDGWKDGIYEHSE
jgi:hypothetical protein